MTRMRVVAPVAGALLMISVMPTVAAGPYDGTWEVEAPNAKGVANPLNPIGCDPVDLHIQVSDNQVHGNIARRTAGREKVENSGSSGAPLTGKVQSDGTVNARWQNILVVGKLSGNTGEVHWQSPNCGARKANLRRVSP